MLVIAWEAMYDAIPRLQAEESLAAYTVAVTASPAHDQQSLQHKTAIVEVWQRTVAGPVRRAHRRIEVTFAALDTALRGVFGRQMR